MNSNNEDKGFRGHSGNIQYTTKVARILNQTEGGMARALSDEPENFLERQYGRLFIALDLDFTSDFYDVGEVLVDTMEREFYLDLNRSVADSFEKALTAVNQTLADLAAEGQSEWVEKLNAVILTLHDNEVHVSKVGLADAYLVRGHSATNITEGLTDDGETQTAKTFINVASGTLEVGDKLVVATGEFLKHLSSQDLRRVLYLHSPVKAIQKFADSLSTKAPKELAAIAVELTTIDLVSAEAVTDEPNEIVMNASRRHFEKLQGFKPFKKDTPIAEYSEKAKKHWNKKLKPGLNRSTASARHKVASWQAKRRGEAPPAPPPRAAAGTPETARTPRPKRTTPDSENSGTSGRAGQKASAAFDSVIARLGRALRPARATSTELWHKTGIPKSNVWRSVSRVTEPVTKQIKTFPFREQLAGNRRVVYRNLILLIALVLLISLALSINAAQNRKAEASIRDRINKIEDVQAKAEAKYIFKDVNGARTQLADAVKQADQLSNESLLKSDVTSLRQSLSVSYDRINNVVSVPNQPLVDFSSTTKKTTLNHLVQSGTTLYAMGDTGAMHSYNQPTKEVKTAQTIPAGSGQIVSTATTSNGDILMLSDKPAVLELDTAAGSVSNVSVETGGSWEKGTAIDTVQQNAFVLDPNGGQIWRHTRTLSAFNKGEPYLDGTQDLKDAVDMVTGAQVYVLKSDGTVTQFSNGKKQGFSLKAPPGPQDKMTDAKAMAQNFSNNNIYVLDPKNHRVVEFTSNGEYSRQFKNDAFTGTEDIVVDDKTNTMFVLAENKVYSVGLG
ncbi:hypothetical protein EXS54_00265 [Patescibacteria group bacterium]|nr:hypothetical protein [Patescibacteria group bacterium]